MTDVWVPLSTPLDDPPQRGAWRSNVGDGWEVRVERVPYSLGLLRVVLRRGEWGMSRDLRRSALESIGVRTMAGAAGYLARKVLRRWMGNDLSCVEDLPYEEALTVLVLRGMEPEGSP